MLFMFARLDESWIIFLPQMPIGKLQFRRHHRRDTGKNRSRSYSQQSAARTALRVTTHELRKKTGVTRATVLRSQWKPVEFKTDSI